MAVTPNFLTFVLDQLAAFGDVTAKRMFGGIGLYRDGRIIGLIDDDIVYLKVDDASRPEYERRAMPAFRPVASKPELISKNYYQLPAEVLEDSDELALWAKRALAASSKPKLTAATAASRRKKSPKRRK